MDLFIHPLLTADQTPTPTRLIKNCEEVGLFEDLRNVNPFEETFRRACENIQQPQPRSHQNYQTEDSDDLHTPQIFPQFDAAVEGGIGISAGEDLSKQTLNTPVVLDVPTVVDTILETPTPVKAKSADSSCLTKYRPIVEKPVDVSLQNSASLTFLPSTVQFIQPQLITVTFPSSTTPPDSENSSEKNVVHATIQKSKTHPLILPKLTTTTTNNKESINNCTSSSAVTSTTSTPHPEPSSASLTPTSQLPIKERLKAILNQSSKSRPPEWPERTDSNKYSNKSPISHKSSSSSHKSSSKDDTMERRRAASTRYRQKMRNEHKDLKKRNTDLQAENEKLKQKIRQLEAQVEKLQSAALQPVLGEFWK